jgi:acyl carrier protein
MGGESLEAGAVQAQIRSFVVSDLALRGDGQALSIDDDLLSGGIVDSMGVMQLVGFVEDRFGVPLADGDIVAENFRSVRALADLVLARAQDGAS